MGARSGRNITALCYIIFILRKAQSVVLFKTFVNFAVSQGLYLPLKKKKRKEEGMKSCYLPQRFGSEGGNNCKLWNSLTCFRSPDRSAAFSSPLSAFSPLQLFFLHQFPHSYSALFLAAQQQRRRWCFYFFFFQLSPPSAISPALSGNSQIKTIPKKKEPL